MTLHFAIHKQGGASYWQLRDDRFEEIHTDPRPYASEEEARAAIETFRSQVARAGTVVRNTQRPQKARII
jgi:hypothetical protein